MKQSIFSCLLFFFLFVISTETNAKHIVGGEVTYTCLGIDTITNKVRFLINASVYRDKFGGGAPFDEEAKFGLFSYNGSSWQYIETLTRPPKSTSDVKVDLGNPCLDVPKNIGVEKGLYQFEIEVPIIAQSYMISYQRCCRNNTIFNILDAGDIGAVYSTIITPQAQRTCDSSPAFKDFPPVVICSDYALEFDHSAIDLNGDNIQYSFCLPQQAGGKEGTNVGNPNSCNGVTPSPKNCRPPFRPVYFKEAIGYTYDNPLGGNPRIKIDPNTGIISGTPNVVGQFVVGVCAKSFRNGVEIGEVRRDFQFNVQKCEVAVKAAIEANIVKGKFQINSCGENTIAFSNKSTDENRIQSYDWIFPVGKDTLHVNTREATITFPDTGRYVGKLYLNRALKFNECKDSATIDVSIFPDIQSDFIFEHQECVSESVSFVDKSFSGAGAVTGWKWSFNDEGESDLKNPSFEFLKPGRKKITLTASDKNNCEAISEQFIDYYPAPVSVVVEPSSFTACTPATLFFKNLSTPIDSTYDVTWDFGNGNIVKGLDATFTFEEEGTYSVNVKIVTPTACEVANSFNNWIKIIPSPEAGFDYTPKELSNFQKTVTFTDESHNAISWLYEIGDYIALSERNPSYTFSDTGVVKVTQYVSHISGCIDSFTAYIDVVPQSILHIPNAFTPNDDGLNDEFLGKGFYDGMKSYKMQIWNRWGELLFQTDNPKEGWNGKDYSERNLPGGVYVYTVQYVPARGDEVHLNGHITLIR